MCNDQLTLLGPLRTFWAELISVKGFQVFGGARLCVLRQNQRCLLGRRII